MIWLSDVEGVQDAVVEGLFRGYFCNGRDLSAPKTLLDVAAEAGLDRGKAEGVLNGTEGMKAIREADELARRVGIRGVPFFILNSRVALSGARPPEAFLAAFRQVSE